MYCLSALMKPTRWMIPEHKYINNKQFSLLLQLKFYFKFKFRTPLACTTVNAPLALHLATFNAFSIWNSELSLDNNRTRYVPAKPLRWTQPHSFEVAFPFLPLRKRNISTWKGSLVGRDSERWFAFWLFLQLEFSSARRPDWKDLLSSHCTQGNVQFSSCTGQSGTSSHHQLSPARNPDGAIAPTAAKSRLMGITHAPVLHFFKNSHHQNILLAIRLAAVLKMSVQ